MKLSARMNLHTETWYFDQPFRIAGRTYDSKTFIVVELSAKGKIGRGEAWMVYYNGETMESVIKDIESVVSEVEQGMTRATLQQRLPSGGARNALDLAMWDLECKLSGKSIWQLTGITPKPVATVLTLGIESTPELMAEKASAAQDYPILKIKLDSEQPVERIQAVRDARPDVRMIIDANQGWSFEQLKEVAPKLKDLGVEMIEQPLPRNKDEVLEGYRCPVMLGADESCLDCSELEQAATRYQLINIKLDKTGGLTEALQLVDAVKTKGLELMVGNMGGTSLCIAPGFVVGQFCRFADLDGPLINRYDRSRAIEYQREMIQIPDAALWG